MTSRTDNGNRERRAAEQLAIIQRIAQIGSWEQILTEHRLLWSDETYRIFGVDPNTFEPTPAAFDAMVHPEDQARVMAIYEEAISGEGTTDTYDVEHRIVRPDGEIRYVRELAELTRDKAGNPVRLVGTVQDLTAQRHVEHELRISEERFRRMFVAAATGIAVADASGRFIDVNPAYADILGYTLEELRRLTFLDVTHPEDRANNMALVQQLLDGEIDSFVLEKRYIRKDGESVWSRMSVALVSSPAGQPLNLIAVAEDITERKLAEEAATSLADQLAQTLESMTDAFFLLDSEWRFVYLNRQAEQVLLRPNRELEGKVIWDEFPAAKGSLFHEMYHRAVATGEPAEFEAYYPPLEHWFEVHAYPSEQGLAVYFRTITERRRAEDALRESEARFRELAEAVEDVFWVRDAESGRILYANSRYEEIFGTTRDELYADPDNYRRYIHPDDLPVLDAAIAENRYAMDVTYRVARPHCAVRHIHVRTFPIYNRQGELVRSVGVGRDLTALVEATEKLRASEEQYRMLFDENPNPMWVFDEETLQFLAVNQAAIEHYGYSEAEFLSMTLRDIRASGRVPELKAALRASPDGDFSGQTRHSKKDGTEIDVQLRTNRLIFDDRMARLVLVNDVSERLRAETRIREQAAYLDKARDAITVRDLNHRITYWNQGAAQLYGWPVEEAIGQPVTELLYNDLTDFNRATQQVMATGEWHGELKQVNRAGQEFLVECRWTLVRNDQGQPYAILAINSDITERKQMESQLLRSQRMESIGTLAGGIAHDLNNALTPIMLAVSLLRPRIQAEDDLKLIEMIENNALRGADMVRQVLTFARGLEGEHIPLDMGHALREVVTLIRETFPRNIRISLRNKGDLWPIAGDPTQIHQLIMNLSVNARDAMPNGGSLELSAENVTLDEQYASMNAQAEPGRYVVMIVSDTGSGISSAIRDRIFDPFFTTKEIGEGTGLGLSTVQAIVKSHHGFVNMYTEEGRGTTFRVYLPAQETLHEETDSRRGSRMPRGNGELILVIDDEETVRSITRQTLEAYGYRALLAEDGAVGLALYAQRSDEIAAVLTDMMMPIMDGYATIMALMRVDPDVTIIAASGLAANGMVAKAATAGVRYFLQKPYTSEALLRKLHEALQGDAGTDK